MERLAGRRVLLGVTGGIAAYKAAIVARRLVAAGATVDVVLTRGAEHFVGAATFEGITGRAVRGDVWDDVHLDTHVAVGRAADAALIYPTTAHTMAKLAGGLADDLLTTTLLAATCPVVIAPAMHTEMWRNPATQSNVEVLRSRGVAIIGPADGPLMGGDTGPGRVVEPDEAVAALDAALAETDGVMPAASGKVRTVAGMHDTTHDSTSGSTAVPAGGADTRTGAAATRDATPTRPDGIRSDPARDTEQDLAGATVIVTAGGTREPIDPVRFLGNRSSGRMGFALAAEAARRGATVELIAASVSLPTPPGVRRTDVVTACEMRDAVFARLSGVDVVVKAAAVADFRPSTSATSKLKKDAGAPVIQLVANPDILAELGEARGDASRPMLVGFAAETDDPEDNGRAKLVRKRADLLVVNDVSDPESGFEVDTNRVIILDRDGGRVEVPLASKAMIAASVIDAVVERRAAGDQQVAGERRRG